MVEPEAEDVVCRRQMALGTAVQADFDEALAQLGSMPRRLVPRPDRGLTVEEAIRRTMLQHRGVFAALADSERRDREADGVGFTNIRRGLTG